MFSVKAPESGIAVAITDVTVVIFHTTTDAFGGLERFDEILDQFREAHVSELLIDILCGQKKQEICLAHDCYTSFSGPRNYSTPFG